MRHITLGSALALIGVLAVAASFACNGDGGSGSGGDSRQPLKLDLPADFPLYPGMAVVRGFQLGESYIFEVSIPDADYVEVLDFYEEELALAGWEVTNREDLEEQGTGTVFFTRESYANPARVGAAADPEREGRTTLGIAFPLAALQEANAAQDGASPAPEEGSGEGEQPREDDAPPDEDA
jgi:hypothetical protein